MIKSLAFTAAAILMAAAPAAAAPDKSPPAKGAEALLDGLQAMMNNGDSPPGQSKRPDDPDQGDDNASETAIDNVCTKDTPAADRSAICDGQPVSPY